MSSVPGKLVIFTIGHSNHPIDTFIGMLETAEIEPVADARSVPYSKRHPQYRKDELAARLKGERIANVFLSKELGARLDDPNCYVDGRVVYDRTAATPDFDEGLRRVEEDASRLRIALMCAERDPLGCHRTLLVSRHLTRHGMSIRHIPVDGASEPGEAAEALLATAMGLEEGDLFLDSAARIEEAYRLRTGGLSR